MPLLLVAGISSIAGLFGGLSISRNTNTLFKLVVIGGALYLGYKQLGK